MRLASRLSQNRRTVANVIALGLGTGTATGPYPAPTGFRWGYVTENSTIVTQNGEPVVELERVAA